MEEAFLWLVAEFGHENIAKKRMLLPTPEHFSIRYDGSENSLAETAEIIAGQMEIDMVEVSLDTYEEGIQEFSSGFGHSVWTQVDKDSEETMAAGLYFDKDEHGKYHILIERKSLADPEMMVAVLAHEFSHIKLLGEKRADINDESLTDLTTVAFGLGIFNANSAFKEHKSFNGYGHDSIGYLKQREWGYALALYAYFRKEENSEWIKYLTPNIRSDFKKSIEFINGNRAIIFSGQML